jgi:hypothetical protein
LTSTPPKQASKSHPKPWEKPDGSLDMDRLMQEIQKFWQRHSEIWEHDKNITLIGV